jgi:hypothetical protein
MHRVVTFLAALGLGTGAMACINDNESPQHEREFRSDYRLAETPPGKPPTAPPDNRYLAAGGLMVLTSAFAVALSRRQSRTKSWSRDSADFS